MVGIFAFVLPLDNPVSGKAIKRRVCIHLQAIAASFQENNLVIDWVNAQPILPVLTCLGDGHDGIWNIISHFAPAKTRREVLDWFHLMENLHKVGGSLKRLKQAKNFLWKGQVSEAIALFADCQIKQAQNFCAYLNKHRHRIINYQYHQAEQICEGSFWGGGVYRQAN